MSFLKRSLLVASCLFLQEAFSSPADRLDARCGCKAESNPRALFLRELLANSNYPHHPTVPTSPDCPLKVGIVGAGAAGLYSAILLDSLGIDYDILEASDRVGGRVFTYRFNETAWDASTPDDPDYYDYYVRIILNS